MTKKTGPALRALAAASDVEAWIAATPPVVVVGFFAEADASGIKVGGCTDVVCVCVCVCL